MKNEEILKQETKTLTIDEWNLVHLFMNIGIFIYRQDIQLNYLPDNVLTSIKFIHLLSKKMQENDSNLAIANTNIHKEFSTMDSLVKMINIFKKKYPECFEDKKDIILENI